MIEFLKYGKRLNGIYIGINVEDLYEILGLPDETVGDDNYGYLYYKQLRYGYNEDKRICEMSVEFTRLENKYEFNDLKSEQYGEVFTESFSISSKTKIHDFIKLLNHLQLSWQANSGNDKNNFTIKIKSGPFIIFDLQDGTPFRISVMDS